MKTLLLLPLLVSLLNFGDGIPVLKYQVKSDVKSTTVPEGKVIVSGKVTENGKPMAQVRISTLNHEKFGITDADGRYQLVLSPNDTALYAYKPHYDEVVTANIDFKSQHVVDIEFYMSLRLMMPMSKPVIYLYPEESTDVSVELKVKGETSFTFPQIDDGWNFNVDPNGTLTDKNGASYPYLFWEGEREVMQFKKVNEKIEGYQIETENTIEFLNARLTEFGLNAKEQADFITYWGPQFVEHKYALVQFFSNEMYDQEVAELAIRPQPESVQRIYMLFSTSDSKMEESELIQPIIPKFDRKGFTVIEWGGSNLTPFQSL